MLSWLYIVPAHWKNSPLGHIILIQSQPLFDLSPWCYEFSEETTNTNCIVWGVTLSGFEPMIYNTRGEHADHYTTDVIAVV